MNKTLDELIADLENSESSENYPELEISNSNVPNGVLSEKQIERISKLNLHSLIINGIKNKNLSQILANIESIKTLEYLELKDTSITTDFEFIKNITTLYDLRINSSHITDFSFLSALKSLVILDLSRCNLKSIPEEIFQLTDLREWRISNNQISEIPEGIKCLKNLEYFDVSYNKLTELPREIEFLEKLTSLQYDNNPLKSIRFIYSFYFPEHEVMNSIKREFEKLNDQFLFQSKNNDFGISTQNSSLFFYNIDTSFPSIFITKKIPNFDYSIKFYISSDNHDTNINLLKSLRSVIEKAIDNLQITDRKRLFYFYDNNKDNLIDLDSLLNDKMLGLEVYSDAAAPVYIKKALKYIGAENEVIKSIWTGDNFITNVKIENFKIFSNLEVKISDQINVFLGANGAGKTSLLQAITLGILQPLNDDKNNDFEKFIQLNQDQSELNISWGNVTKQMMVFKYNLHQRIYIDTPQKFILSYGTNLNTDAELNHSGFIAKMIKGVEPPYATKSILLESYKFYDPLLLLERLTPEIRKSNNEKDKKEITNIVNLFVNTINSYLNLFSDAQKIQLDIDNNCFIDNFGSKLELANLSEGFKDFVLQTTDMVIRVIASRKSIFGNSEIEISEAMFQEIQGVILIDEFDRHLHPQLQRTYLKKLKQDFKKIQFFLSTHNPLSLQSAEGHDVHILYEEEGQMKIRSEKTTEGLTIDSIYKKFYHVNSSYGIETEVLIGRFKEELNKIYKNEIDAKNEEFKKIVIELTKEEYSDSIKNYVNRELVQLENYLNIRIEI